VVRTETHRGTGGPDAGQARRVDVERADVPDGPGEMEQEQVLGGMAELLVDVVRDEVAGAGSGVEGQRGRRAMVGGEYHAGRDQRAHARKGRGSTDGRLGIRRYGPTDDARPAQTGCSHVLHGDCASEHTTAWKDGCGLTKLFEGPADNSSDTAR